MQESCALLNDRIIAVTGASSGIGQATAIALSKAGAKVACCGRNAEKLERVRSSLSGSGHASYVFDSNELSTIEDTVALIVKEMGRLSGLVHAAGVSSVQLLRDIDFHSVEEMFRINYLAFMAFAQAVCRKTNHTAGQTSIVGISSLAALSPDPGLSAYASSKAALNASIAALGREYASRGIRFNAVCPSYVNTPMNQGMKANIGEDAFNERIKKSMPLGMIEPEDIAASVIFLLSDTSRRITGTALTIDSGGNFSGV